MKKKVVIYFILSIITYMAIWCTVRLAGNDIYAYSQKDKYAQETGQTEKYDGQQAEQMISDEKEELETFIFRICGYVCMLIAEGIAYYAVQEEIFYGE